MHKTRPSLLKSSLVGAFASFLLLSSAAFADGGEPHYFWMNSGHNAQSQAAALSGGPLIDHGGPVLQNSTTYTIFWGGAGFPSDLRTAMSSFLAGFGSSVYSYIEDQYFSAIGTSQYISTLVHDPSTPPAGSPTTAQIVNEVCRVIKAKRLPFDPVDSTTNSGGVYFVLTSNFPKNINFCGWHAYGPCQGQNIAVSYIPNLKNQAGCDPGNLFGANSYSQGARADVNVVAHELSEAITDPELNAWYDSVGFENGDKCAWVFDSAVTLANSTTWQVQDEWSNLATGCVQEQATP